MRTPQDKVVSFLFVSHPVREKALRWSARVTFPSGATENTALDVRIVDGFGEAIASGVFEFAGKHLVVKDGVAAMTMREFVCGRHETALWLHRPGILPVPGGPTFG